VIAEFLAVSLKDEGSFGPSLGKQVVKRFLKGGIRGPVAVSASASAVLVLIGSDLIACAILGPSGWCCASFAPARLALDAEREKPGAVCGIGQMIAGRIDHSQHSSGR